MAESVCTTGSVGVAKLLKLDLAKKRFEDEANCLHIAVANGRVDMVRYLLQDYPSLAVSPTASLNETPLFFVLSKLKD